MPTKPDESDHEPMLSDLHVCLQLIVHIEREMHYKDLFGLKTKEHQWPFVGDVTILFRAVLSTTMIGPAVIGSS